MKKNQDERASSCFNFRRRALRRVLYVSMVCVALMMMPLSVSGQKIESFAVRNTTLKEALQKLEKQVNMGFFYNAEKIESVKGITLSMKNTTLEEVLKKMLHNTGFVYEIVDKNVVIRKATPEPGKADKGPRRITGKVFDSHGKTIPGVTVFIKNLMMGTTTDLNGEFSIDIDKADRAELRFSFVGMKSEEIVIPNLKKEIAPLKVVLEDEVQEIDELVVTGLFSRPKESYTGAARSFTKEQLMSASSSNVLRALSTLDPSVQMPQDINLGSDPNALASITLRGGNSLIDPQSAEAAFNYSNDPNTPLFILDGFEVSLTRINDLDINRVKSVVTLKDATATTIYGSRAANGVIVIETIPAERGRLRLSYTGQVSFEFPDLKGYDLLNAREKLELDMISAPTDGINGYPYNLEARDLIFSHRAEQIAKGVDFDWMHLPLRNAIGHKHTLYIEGGDESITYAVSASYDKNNGVMRKSGRDNTMISSSLQYRYKGLLLKNELSVAFNKAYNSPFGSFSEYVKQNPYHAPVDEDGNIPFYLERLTNLDGSLLTSFTNPYYNASLNVIDESKYHLITENLFAQWNACDWLKLTARVAYTKQQDESDLFYPAAHTSFASISSSESYKKGSYTKGYGSRESLEGTFTLDVSKSFRKHVMFLSMGMNVQETSYNTESYKVEGFQSDRADQILMGNRFPEDSKVSGSESISRLMGYFANATYTYDARYLFDASFRYDGSSQFGNDRRFAPFYSLGVGWNIHNEKFLKKQEVINNMKLRYSYGYTGSQNFESYLGITTSTYFTDQSYRNNYGTYLMGYGNSALQWQRTQKHNLGLDLTLFHKLNIAFNYFKETTKGSIATINVAPSTGFSTYKENMGDVANKGWELYTQFTVYSRPLTRENWSLFFNAFHVKGKIEKVSNVLLAMNEENETSTSLTPLSRYVAGMSTTAIWAVKSLGIDPGTGREIYQRLDGSTTNTYSSTDQQVVGDTRPTMEGTFGTNFEYKGFGANVFFRYRFGGDAYNQTLATRVENADLDYNVDRRVLEERWQRPGDRTFFKGTVFYKLYTDGPAYERSSSPTYATSRFVEKDNMLSLESVSLYYRFSDKFNRKLGLSNTKISFYMDDVAWWSSIKRERGLDYPFSRSFSLQLQFTF